MNSSRKPGEQSVATIHPGTVQVCGAYANIFARTPPLGSSMNVSLGCCQATEEEGVDEQHEQFLKAVYDARAPRGNAFISDLDDIAENLGIDPVRDKGDRDLYREVMLALRDAGYVECQATRDMVPCAWVQITERGLAYFES